MIRYVARLKRKQGTECLPPVLMQRYLLVQAGRPSWSSCDLNIGAQYLEILSPSHYLHAIHYTVYIQHTHSGTGDKELYRTLYAMSSQRSQCPGGLFPGLGTGLGIVEGQGDEEVPDPAPAAA